MQISPSKKSLAWGLSFSVSLIAIGEASAERIAKSLAQKPSPQFIKAERKPNKHIITSTKASHKKPQTKPLSSYTLNFVKLRGRLVPMVGRTTEKKLFLASSPRLR